MIIAVDDSDVIGRLLPPRLDKWKVKRDKRLAKRQKKKEKAQKKRVSFQNPLITVKFLNFQTPTMTTLYEPRSEKTGLRGFRPGPTQTRL